DAELLALALALDQGEVLGVFRERLLVGEDDALPGVPGVGPERGGHAVVAGPRLVVVAAARQVAVEEGVAVPDAARQQGGPVRLVDVEAQVRPLRDDLPFLRGEEPAAAEGLQQAEGGMGSAEVGGAE